MSLLLNYTPILSSLSHLPKRQELSTLLSSSPSLASAKLKKRNGFQIRASFFNPTQERILKEAIKEPIAFMGGVFAGILRLDLNDDPLKEWVTKTVEASGITEEELNADVSNNQEEETPQEIEIE